MGTEIFRQAPPMPEAVVTDKGDTVYARADIELGRQVWQSIGGQQLGSCNEATARSPAPSGAGVRTRMGS